MTAEKTKPDLTEIQKLSKALTSAEARPEEQIRILEALIREARRLLATIPDKKPRGS